MTANSIFHRQQNLFIQRIIYKKLHQILHLSAQDAFLAPPRRLAYLHEQNPSSITSFHHYITILEDKLSAINSPAIQKLTTCSNMQANPSPISFSNNSPTSKEALTGQHSSDFLLAEQAELDKLHQLNTWTIVNRNDINKINQQYYIQPGYIK